MQIIEMTGCPGCGKTTTCAIATKKLKEGGVRVANLTDFYFQHRKNRNRLGMIMRILLDFPNYKLYFDSLRIKKKYGRNSSSMSYVGSLMFFIYEISYTSRKNLYDLLLLDEGIVQYISSLFYLENLPKEFEKDKLFKHLRERGINPTIVFCDLDLEENIRRLTGRGVKTRFSSIENRQELEQAMIIRKNNLFRISNGIGIATTIDMNNNIILNAQIVQEQYRD